MLKRTKQFGLAAWFFLSTSGCAAILGNDWEVDPDAGPSSATPTGAGGATATPGSSSDVSGAGGNLSTSSTSGPGSSSGTAGDSGAGGASGAGTSSAGGAGGNATTGSAGDAGSSSSSAAGSSGAGGAAGAGGASATGGNGGAGGGTTAAGGGGSSGTGGAGGSTVDASVDSADDASVVDAGPPDTPTGNEAAPDVTSGSDAADGARDAVVDAAPCNPVNGSCASGSLVCNAGYATCNSNALDGCECATPGCCGATCQTKHVACMLNNNPNTPCTDGTGVNYYDCVAVGTITSTQSTKACAAFTGDIAACAGGSCPGNHLVTCSFDGTGNCVCWEYSGSLAGRMYKSTDPNCFCPTSTSPRWN